MQRPRLLYLVHRVPYPPDKGDRIRAFHILRVLQQHADVDLACLADEPVSDSVATALRGYCRELGIVRLGRWRWARALGSHLHGGTITEGAFASSGLRRILRDWTSRFTYSGALASSSALVPYLRMKETSNIPAVIDLVDVDSEKWFDYSAAKGWPRSWLYRLEGRRLRKLEQELVTRARAITLVSDSEAELYRRFCPGTQAHSITNGVDLDFFSCADREKCETACVFVGALNYYPNIDAACWFCAEVWPEILRRRPEARFYIVGRRPVRRVRALIRHPGVEVIADAADVRPYLRKAAVAVAPLRIARGLQNKVLEACAMGCAVVASRQALVALKTRPGVHLLCPSSPADWVRIVLDIFDNDMLRRRLGDAGRRFVEENHNWERCLAPFRGLLGLAAPAREPSYALHASAL